MDPITVTPAVLAAIAGALLSLLFSYVPGLNTKFASLEDTSKKLIMAGLLLVVAATLFGLSCGAILQTGLTCDRLGVIQLVYMFVLAIVANQGVFQLTPQTKAVKAAKP